MSQINFGMLNDGGGFQNALMQGVQYGTHLRQQKQAQEREAAVDNAYRGMIAGDPNAVNALAQVDPRAAYQMKVGQDQNAQAERERQIKVRAAQGDKAAIAELAGVDWDAWTKISQPDKDALKRKVDYLGQAALRISQAPEAQRAQMWDAYVQQGVQMGYGDLAEYQGQYNPQALEALIANAGQVSKLFELERPQYMAVPNDADLVNVKDPDALKAFGEQRASVPSPMSKEDYDALPPGAQYTAPDGSIRTKGGQTQQASGGFPKVGANVLDRATVAGESGGRRYSANGGYLTSPKGAMGEWQVMPATARDPGFGIKAWNGTPDDLARVGAQYRRKMEQRYGGDLAKMWAAYNAGPGRVDEAIKTHGANWLRVMPAETREYVAGMFKRVRQ